MRLVAIAFGVLWLLMPPSFWSFYPPYTSESERFGVGLAGPAQDILQYDVAELGAGWYTNWSSARYPPHPGGVEYVQTIRISGSSYRPDLSAIAQIASANPGSVWIIGNEPDCIWQDNSTPAQYAVVYHDLYAFIKGQDASAKVAIGGMVQATPLRMQYLDLVLGEYQARYGGMIPVDVWNVHAFILREQRGGWGCEIPPGLSASAGALYLVRDQDDLGIFREQIVRFRQWMKEKGEQNKPLIVTEYGILWPADMSDEDGIGFDHARVRDFMLATFDFFLGVDPEGIDTDLGYPADGYRLVQAWAWYSLDDDAYDVDGTWLGGGYNGDLYRGGLDKQLTPLGQDYADYVADNGLVTHYVDLYPAEIAAQPHEPVYGQPVTVSLSVQIANRGNVTATAPLEVGLWDGDPSSGGTSIGTLSTDTGASPRYGPTAAASTSWQTMATGTHQVYVQLDPSLHVAESRRDNNVAWGEMSFYTDWGISAAGAVHQVGLFAGEPMTLTLGAEVENIGNAAGQGVRVQFSEDGVGPIGEATLDIVQGLGGSSDVQVLWPVSSAGPHTIRVVVDPWGNFPEPDESNNEISTTVLVPSHAVCLPLVAGSVP